MAIRRLILSSMIYGRIMEMQLVKLSKLKVKFFLLEKFVNMNVSAGTSALKVRHGIN